MNLKKVTVIIPVYNAEEYLPECLDSVFNQTLNSIEIICIDDGSTDDSIRIINKYAEDHGNIRVYSQNHLGPGKARNLGIDKAEGEYIAFLDADDFWRGPDSLQILVDASDTVGCDVIGSYCCTFDNGNFDKHFLHRENRVEMKDGFWRVFCKEQNIFCYWSYLYRTDFLKFNQFYFRDYLRGQDPPFLFDCLDKVANYYIVPVEWYVYRINHKSTCLSQQQIVDLLRSIIEVVVKAKEKGYTSIIDDYIKRAINNVNVFYEISKGDIEVLSLYFTMIREAGISDTGDTFCDIIGNALREHFEAYKNNVLDKFRKRPVVIYGAGDFGTRTHEALKKRGFSNIKCFAVTEKSDTENKNGLPVIEVSSISIARDEVQLIIAADKREEMIKHAHQLGYNDIIETDLLFQLLFWKY